MITPLPTIITLFPYHHDDIVVNGSSRSVSGVRRGLVGGYGHKDDVDRRRTYTDTQDTEREKHK